MRPILVVATLPLLLAAPAFAQGLSATGTFLDTDGQPAGTLEITQTEQGVAFTGNAQGLPAGELGIHIHETGTCDPAADFESAGAHFNPTSHQHGLENPQGPHAGDLPNLTVAEDGTTVIDAVSTMVSLNEGEPGYLLDADGSAVVIHEAADDNVTDPSGNSGARIACAVIEADPAAN